MLQAKASLIKEESGSAGILSVITLLLLSVVGAAYLSLSSSESSSSANYRNGVAAQFLAEAGARRAIVELDKNASWAGVSNIAMGSGITAGVYTVTVSAAGQDRIVVAKGVVGNATRRIKLTLTVPGNAFPYLVYSGNSLTLNSGFSVAGGDVATAKNQVTNNGFSGTVHVNVPMSFPTIPVSFAPVDYAGGNKTTLVSQPNTGDYNLSGLYYIAGSFNTNSDVNILTTAGNNATIFVDGSVSINGNINGNITIIASQGITTNSGTTIDGTVKLYAGSDIALNRPMTGDITIMCANNLTLNSGAGQLNKAAVYAAHNIMFNSGVDLTGVVVAGNDITFNGGKVTYSPLGFSAAPAGTLSIKAWAPDK